MPGGAAEDSLECSAPGVPGGIAVIAAGMSSGAKDTLFLVVPRGLAGETPLPLSTSSIGFCDELLVVKDSFLLGVFGLLA